MASCFCFFLKTFTLPRQRSGMTEKVDSVCLYAYQWGSITLDVVATSAPDSASIPMRDMYDKVIPDIKRNVLSSRMSKIGVHSHALLEPYVVALRKLGLTASARSHYIKVVDFIKLCQYYHRSPPEGLGCFSNVTSESPVDEVLRMVREDSISLDANHGDAGEVPYVPLGVKSSGGSAPGSNYSTPSHQMLNFISADGKLSIEVDKEIERDHYPTPPTHPHPISLIASHCSLFFSHTQTQHMHAHTYTTHAHTHTCTHTRTSLLS